jgi:hypothetical protein
MADAKVKVILRGMVLSLLVLSHLGSASAQDYHLPGVVHVVFYEGSQLSTQRAVIETIGAQVIKHNEDLNGCRSHRNLVFVPTVV